MAHQPHALDLQRACEDACMAARLAWEKIAGFYRGTFEVYEKASDGPATEADIMADRFIVAWLRERYPEDQFGYLSEETANTPERLERDYCWIIDPIDGTSDFIQGGADFAVQIGLAGRGANGTFAPLLGVVYQPVTGMLFRGTAGYGAWREHLPTGEILPLKVSGCDEPGGCTLVVTRSHMGPRLRCAMEAVGAANTYAAGSLGVKVAHVAERRADLYLNTSRRFCKEWDTCAPHAILEEAGGRLTDLLGRPITYNKADVYIEDGIVASNGALHDDIILRLANVTELWAN